jgi:hypothetical protein
METKTISRVNIRYLYGYSVLLQQGRYVGDSTTSSTVKQWLDLMNCCEATVYLRMSVNMTTKRITTFFMLLLLVLLLWISLMESDVEKLVYYIHVLIISMTCGWVSNLFVVWLWLSLYRKTRFVWERKLC